MRANRVAPFIGRVKLFFGSFPYLHKTKHLVSVCTNLNLIFLYYYAYFLLSNLTGKLFYYRKKYVKNNLQS